MSSSPSENKKYQVKTYTEQEIKEYQKDKNVQIGIEIAIQKIQEKYSTKSHEGLSSKSFFLGVVNVVISSYIFGQYPQNYWLFYLIKLVVLLPIKIYRAFQTNFQYYFLEICWIAANPLFWSTVAILFLFDEQTVSMEFKIKIFRLAFALATGQIGFAVALVGNKMVFHSIENTLSLFIHLTPCTVFYILRWKFDIINQHYPGAYSLGDDYNNINGYQELYFPAVKFYLCWWVPYTIWLILSGWKLDEKYRSAFNDSYRFGLQNKIQTAIGGKNQGKTQIKAMALVTTHLIIALILIQWSIVCWNYEIAHFSFLVFMICLSIWNGSKYYMFILGPQFIKALQTLQIDKKIK